MAQDIVDLKHMVAAWPGQLTHPGGEAFITFSLHPGFIEAKWNGHITAESVVAAANTYLALMHKMPKAKLLNDKTNATGDWTEANDWIEFEWLPQAIHSGLNSIAYVYSHNMFSRLSSRDLIQRLTPHISIQYFNEPALAKAWLLSGHIPDQAMQSTT